MKFSLPVFICLQGLIVLCSFGTNHKVAFARQSDDDTESDAEESNDDAPAPAPAPDPNLDVEEATDEDSEDSSSQLDKAKIKRVIEDKIDSNLFTWEDFYLAGFDVLNEHFKQESSEKLLSLAVDSIKKKRTEGPAAVTKVCMGEVTNAQNCTVETLTVLTQQQIATIKSKCANFDEGEFTIEQCSSVGCYGYYRRAAALATDPACPHYDELAKQNTFAVCTNSAGIAQTILQIASK